MGLYKIAIIAMFLVFSVAQLADARNRGGLGNSVAISQGISSPSMTSTVNFGNGFTHENPVGVIYQDSIRISGHYDNGDSSTGYGGELGVGNGSYGLAVGALTRDCDGCDADVGAAAAAVFSGIGLGIRFEEDVYSLGIILNPNGQHRIGIMADRNTSVDGLEFNGIGFGYTYMGSSFKFTVDASSIVFDDDANSNDVILVTPGLAFNINIFTLSVSYDVRLNDDNDNNDDTDLWVGLGIKPSSSWEIAVYADYFNDIAVAASFYF